MIQSRDFKDLLNILGKHDVRYLIVGGYAVMLYSQPRWTNDLDIWISTKPENGKAVFEALKEFGAPLKGLTEKDFSEPGYFYTMGNPPLRVDVLMEIPGGEFEKAWAGRNTVRIGDVPAQFISVDDLIAAKLAAGRDRDLEDVESIKKAQKRR